MESLVNIDLPLRSATLSHIPLYLSVIVIVLLLNYFVTAIYSAYFHPLSKFPGPKLAAATRLIYEYHHASGKEVAWIQSLHQKYGEVVRFTPDKLSYICPQAWKDIAGHRIGGRVENSKDHRFFTPEPNGARTFIGLIDPAEHGRFRKVFTHAFSNKALELQEPLIRGYVNKLVDVIKRGVAKDPESKFNIVRLYNFTTFDIMGDLTFGESLGLLDSGEYLPWIESVMGNIKFFVVRSLAAEFPRFGPLIRYFTPQKIFDMAEETFSQASRRVDLRLAKGLDIGKPDIWKLVLEKGKDVLTLNQMYAEANGFMIVGTETTATLLSGVTFFLLKNPDKMQKVLTEVRSLAEHELSLTGLPRLPYLNACFQEGFRMYPPVPTGVPRVIPKGGNAICGEWLPEGTRVLVSQYAAYQSATNFKDPQSFIPERWLPNTGYDSDNQDVLQPFSVGPRNCLGKNLAYHEMRIIFATLMWHFDLELCLESRTWNENQKSYTLWEKPELLVKARLVK